MSGRAGGGASGSPFLRRLRERARAQERTLVFPEGQEARIQRAVAEGQQRGLFRAVLVGEPEVVRTGVSAAGGDPGAIDVIDPVDAGRVARAEVELAELLAGRNVSPQALETMARDPLVQAGLLVRAGEAHGAVAGSVRTTADVVRAALTCVGLAPGIETLSSAFYMVFDGDGAERPGVLTFADAGVVPAPKAAQLAEIALGAAEAHRRVVGEEPRVGFLSYSTKGSAEGESVTLVREALERFRSIAPNVAADGELQGDAALDPVVAARKAPGSEVAGRANVLVFPDLAAANIAYKLVQHLGGAQALGPVLQGLAKPYNDLSRGASADDIVAVACVTSLMAA